MTKTDEERWDERYRTASKLWSHEPNPHLVAEASTLAAGSALDVGAGEGADAIWLATNGWRVSAVDVSSVALKRAATLAAAAGAEVAARIAWVHADLEDWDPLADSFDLVSIQFLHHPSEQRRRLYGRLAGAVKLGGCLLVVGHDPSDLQVPVRRPDPDLLFSAERLVAELGPGFRPITVATRPRASASKDGGNVTVHDAVVLARRLPAA